MPNISFDIFFDQDFINISATRGKTAPKAKPAWKVRSAPKLPPKPKPEDHSGAVQHPQRAKINEGRPVVGKPTQVSDKPVAPSDSASQVADKPRRKPPKLGPRKSASVVSDALAPTVSRSVATAGGFAGGAVNAVGNTVNGIGDGINRYVRGFGDGTMDYGNAIMDWTAAEGPRKQTASNPLGLSSGKAGGKRAVTSPSMYYAPKSDSPKLSSTTNRTATAPKRINGAPAKKAIGGTGAASKATKPQTATSKPAASKASAPAKPTAVKPTGPNPGAMRGGGAQAKKPVQRAAATSSPRKAVPSTRATDASKPKAHQPATYMSSKAASNPVGISW